MSPRPSRQETVLRGRPWHCGNALPQGDDQPQDLLEIAAPWQRYTLSRWVRHSQPVTQLWRWLHALSYNGQDRQDRYSWGPRLLLVPSTPWPFWDRAQSRA